MMYDIAVIGGGPAGLSAAVQARQRNRTAVVVSGDDRDGPLSKTERVDNYLGIHGVTGPELLERFKAHAEAMGVARVTGRALNIMFSTAHSTSVWAASWSRPGRWCWLPGWSAGPSSPARRSTWARASATAPPATACCTGAGTWWWGRSAEAPEEADYLHGLGCRVTYTAPVRPEDLNPEIPFVKAAKLRSAVRER